MSNLNGLGKLAWILVVVGALNWGLVGAFDFNLVSKLVGTWPVVEKAVYVLVGLSALVSLFGLGKKSTQATM